MRAAEEPLKSDLDVKGLKAQVLERIEVLEERGSYWQSWCQRWRRGATTRKW
jgi:hypothetical protein